MDLKSFSRFLEVVGPIGPMTLSTLDHGNNSHYECDDCNGRKSYTVFYGMNCKFAGMNCLSYELQFTIHSIGFLEFFRQVLNSDAAAGAAASDATTSKAIVKAEAAAQAPEAPTAAEAVSEEIDTE